MLIIIELISFKTRMTPSISSEAQYIIDGNTDKEIRYWMLIDIENFRKKSSPEKQISPIVLRNDGQSKYESSFVTK